MFSYKPYLFQENMRIKKKTFFVKMHVLQLFGVELTTELCLFDGPEGGTPFPFGSILKNKPGLMFEPGASYFLIR